MSRTETIPLPLLGGHLCLDFANTLEWRGSARQRDWLLSYDDLLRWARSAGAIGEREAVELAAYADWAPGSAADAADRARALRDAIYGVASAMAAGGSLGREDLEDLNAHMAPLLAETRLRAVADGKGAPPAGPGLVPVWGGAPEDLARVLWPVARSAFELLSGSASGRLRECAGPDCHWLFLDRSKNGSRRWCAMSNCGNLAKARRHRSRVKNTG